MVTLVEHDPSWRQAFAAEAARVREALGALVLRIDHVGSTAVPGLPAKPVIDLQVSLASLEPRDDLRQRMSRLGYVHVDLGPFDRVYPYFTRPAVWPSSHHVHLCVAGSPEERDHLAFRDWLRLDANGRQAYGALKLQLASRHEGTTLASQERYSLSKSAFVRSALSEAYRLGLPLPGPGDA